MFRGLGSREAEPRFTRSSDRGRRRLARTLWALLAGVAGLIAARPAFAWGPVGHRVVADVADKNLTAATKKTVTQLLGPDTSLADIANWADADRVTETFSYNWHFVDIPLKASDYDPKRDCVDGPKGDCVIAALTRQVAVLKDKTASEDDRVRALKFVVHFVGDEHQPLHAEDNQDKGGNDVRVKWFNHSDNLHRVWDSDIITEEHLDEAALAGQLNASMTKKQKTKLQAGTFVDWALEAHKAAQDVSYPDVPKAPPGGVPELDNRYYEATYVTVNTQLAHAGIRLAKVLNDALGGKK